MDPHVPPSSPGSRTARDPLLGVERLLVDGTNLLYRMRRPTRGSEPQPPAALIGRLRAIIPAATRIELVFDGAPEHGLAGARIANGLIVRHSGRDSADALLDRLVADVAGSGGSAEAAARATDAILVVTDDRELGERIRRRGGRVAGANWLIGRLDRARLGSPAVGAPKAPRPPAPGDLDDDPDRVGWQPGRGATRKTGNPRRRARMGR